MPTLYYAVGACSLAAVGIIEISSTVHLRFCPYGASGNSRRRILYQPASIGVTSIAVRPNVLFYFALMLGCDVRFRLKAKFA